MHRLPTAGAVAAGLVAALAAASLLHGRAAVGRAGTRAAGRPASPRVMTALQMPEAAVEEFGRQAKPSDDATRRARALWDAGDIPGAEAECLKAVALSPRVAARGVASPTNAYAVNLLGEIYLREDKNRLALQTFLGRVPYDVGGGVNVNIAIAYCRLHDYGRAKAFLPDGAVMRFYHMWDPRNLPGTGSLASLEASALLIRGANSKGVVRDKDALADFLAAERLVPRNPAVAYWVGYMYLYGRAPAVQNAEEALPRWRRVASAGHGRMAAEAKKHIEGLTAWFYWHPTPRVKVEIVNHKMVFTKG